MNRKEILTIIAALHLLDMKDKHSRNPALYQQPRSNVCIEAADQALSSIETDPYLNFCSLVEP